MRRRSAFSSLSYADWPTLDRQLFDTARCPGDILQPGGPASLWRPATVQWAVESYGCWLWWCQREGELDATEDPARRCTPERLRDYLGALQGSVAPATVANRMRARMEQDLGEA